MENTFIDGKTGGLKSTEVAVYARVSTDTQELEHQLSSCVRYCDYKQFIIKSVYKDVGSGKEWKTRPEFVRLVGDLRSGKFEGIVVFRLDRLFRNVVEAVNFIQEWENRGIRIYSISENLDSSTAIGRAMRDIILVLAALERENISEATKARLEVLKADGIKLGRKPIKKADLEKIVKFRAEGKSINQIVSITGIPRGTVGKYSKIIKT